ncbi:MAG: bifunctional (p)ppGpp synthetase/guanosine-3',5'-bis(diphosphate) 3'-pyrophosphohydrolase [Muribaculaceae bacterium]|nr:bifunctional (p)ppGpp synthetase/guanosine-3',5'-bis(diphosphate) 3'-pyrophosphohydrolase [Muribaculaceae bacterium]
MVSNVRYTPEQEDQMVQAAFQDVLKGYLESNHRKKVEIIERAFNFAREAHRGIRRRSGEPYILHPIAVAKIASQEIGLGSTSICAALLHDVVEDTDYTVDDIRNNFGEKIASIVDGLTKISGGIFGDKASIQAENFRKLLLTMAEDIRVILIKMADRLHNMRTLGSMAPHKQFKIAGETLYIYAPLAHRLGLYAIKTELEDLAFKYEHPQAYERVKSQIVASEEERNRLYNNFAAPIVKRLEEKGIDFVALNRVKSVYSIWRKMETKQIPFEEVYDLYAMRIIFRCENNIEKEKSICYDIYNTITSCYHLHPERTRDWIVNPKANGYQALHITAMGPDGVWVEVQIRSERMDEIAERGFAAHWKYKTGESEEETELNKWIQTIQDILKNPEPNALDFLNTFKLNLFASEIVVFTRDGDVLNLPKDATVLDFAFNIHTNIGATCIAAKVNHKLVPLSHKLNSGDQVEILTSKTQTPKEEWINDVVTARGKTRLRSALKKQRHIVVEAGRKIYRDFLVDNELPASNDMTSRIISELKVKNREDLYYQLGEGKITLTEDFVNQLKSSTSKLSRFFRFGFGGNKTDNTPSNKDLSRQNDTSDDVDTPKINTKEVYVLRYGNNEDNFRFDDCCHPIPGDDVLGFIDDNGEVVIHDQNCPHAQALKATRGQRIVATRWEEETPNEFLAAIHVEGIDRIGILHQIIGIISQDMSFNMRRLNIESDKEVFRCDLSLMVNNAEIVTNLCDKLKKIDGVKIANRVS